MVTDYTIVGIRRSRKAGGRPEDRIGPPTSVAYLRRKLGREWSEKEGVKKRIRAIWSDESIMDSKEKVKKYIGNSSW